MPGDKLSTFDEQFEVRMHNCTFGTLTTYVRPIKRQNSSDDVVYEPKLDWFRVNMHHLKDKVKFHNGHR